MTIQQLRQQRRAMAHRKRRIIFNNDGDDLSMLGKGAKPDPLVPRERAEFAVDKQGLLAVRSTALLDSQVDSIWYYSSHGLRIRHAQGPYGAFFGPSDPHNAAVRNLEALLARHGQDALQIMIEAGHKHDLEVFYSNRMNDTHDSFWPKITRRIKIEHPEYTLLPAEEGRKFGWDKYPDVRTLWAALNFEYEQVRQMTVEALTEVCQTYDIDGIELDFLRHPLYFKPTMQHRAVEAEHIAMMNEMVGQIRRMTEAEGLRRGRPLLVAARCADDALLSRSIGLDVETWLREGSIDILVMGSWIDFALPMKALIDLAHEYEVPAYAMVNCTYKADHDWTIWRGDAKIRFTEGADGVYMFNMFDPQWQVWRELGDPGVMADKDTTYVWDYLPAQRATSDVLAKVRLTRSRRPVTVTNEGCEPMPLYIGEDLNEPPPEGKRRTLALRVHVSGLTKDCGLTVWLNGTVLRSVEISPAPTETPQDLWLDFVPDAKLFRSHENSITAAVRKPHRLTIDDIRLNVRFVD